MTEAGTATYEYVNDRITLSGGPNSVPDPDGSAIIVRPMEDNYRTNDDPQSGPGMSGDRVAAGTIQASEPMSATGGANTLPPAALLLLASAGILPRGAGREPHPYPPGGVRNGASPPPQPYRRVRAASTPPPPSRYAHGVATEHTTMARAKKAASGTASNLSSPATASGSKTATNHTTL